MPFHNVAVPYLIVSPGKKRFLCLRVSLGPLCCSMLPSFSTLVAASRRPEGGTPGHQGSCCLPPPPLYQHPQQRNTETKIRHKKMSIQRTVPLVCLRKLVEISSFLFLQKLHLPISKITGLSMEAERDALVVIQRVRKVWVFQRLSSVSIL